MHKFKSIAVNKNQSEMKNLCDKGVKTPKATS